MDGGRALPAKDERRYQIEFDVDIPATLFPSHNVWEHLQIFTRLHSPSEEGPLQIERDDAEELRRDTLGVAHRLKQLEMRFERACVAAAAQLREQPDPDIAETLTDLVTSAVELIAEMRRRCATTRRPGVRPRVRAGRRVPLVSLIEFFAGCERASTTVLCGAARAGCAMPRGPRICAASSPRGWPKSWRIAAAATTSTRVPTSRPSWRSSSSARRA